MWLSTKWFSSSHPWSEQYSTIYLISWALNAGALIRAHKSSLQISLTLWQLYFLKLFICAEQIIHRMNLVHMTFHHVPVRSHKQEGELRAKNVNCIYFLFIYFLISIVQHTQWLVGLGEDQINQRYGGGHSTSICLELKPNVSTGRGALRPLFQLWTLECVHTEEDGKEMEQWCAAAWRKRGFRRE